MDFISETPRINILINLSSRLLCEALLGLLEKDAENYRTVVVHDLATGEGFEPDKILVDAAAMDQFIPASWGAAKVILIDTGHPEEHLELVRK